MNNKHRRKETVLMKFLTLEGMKPLLICISIFFCSTSLSAQKGFSFSFSSGYRMPLGSSPDQSNYLFGTGSQYYNNYVPVITSFGKGFYATLGGGYTTKKGIETGCLFTYQQGVTKATFDDSVYNKSVYKSNSYTITPYIRIRKSVAGPFIPYIHFGFPISFAQATIESEYKRPNTSLSTYKDNYPRQLTLGINGGIGFYNVLSNHWQLFFELNFIGLKLEPKKVITTNTAGVTTETRINTSEQRNMYGTSVVLPFSNWGVGLGIRYNVSKMIENL